MVTSGNSISESLHIQRWESITESLADQLLWDHDFEMADAILDLDPGKAELLKQMLGMANTYYSSVSADVRRRSSNRSPQFVDSRTRSRVKGSTQRPLDRGSRATATDDRYRSHRSGLRRPCTLTAFLRQESRVDTLKVAAAHARWCSLVASKLREHFR
jgi:hypothetical protein